MSEGKATVVNHVSVFQAFKIMNKNKTPNTVHIVPTLNISLKTTTHFGSEDSFSKWLILSLQG
jgi:hypothetical protein